MRGEVVGGVVSLVEDGRLGDVRGMRGVEGLGGW